MGVVNINWESPLPGWQKPVQGVKVEGFDTGATASVHALQTIAGVTGRGERPLTRLLSTEVMNAIFDGDDTLPVYNPRAHVVNVPESDLKFVILFGVVGKVPENRLPRGRFKTVLCQFHEVHDVVRSVYGAGALPLFEGDT